MEADSWPPLSQLAKPHQKSSAVSSSKLLSSQGSGPYSPSALKQVPDNSHPSPGSIQSQTYPVRQKSFKHHGGNASRINGSYSYTQPPQPPIVGQSATAPFSGSQKNIDLESGPKITSQSQSHGSNDRPRHTNPHRRVNGHLQNGDGSSNHRSGARNDQHRPNRDWNSQQSFNGRDVQPQGTGFFPRGIISQIPMPHDSAPYIAPQLSPVMRPFGPPVGFPEFPFYYVPIQPESIRRMSIPYPAPAPHQIHMHYTEIYSKVIHQIDYYFSNENLIKDIFLRKNMDEQGWVPIKLIAGFAKVKNLTDDIAFITKAIRTSTLVEVKDDKIRRQNDWKKWIMPESLRITSQPTYPNPISSTEFASRIQKMHINGESADIPNTTPLSTIGASK